MPNTLRYMRYKLEFDLNVTRLYLFRRDSFMA